MAQRELELKLEYRKRELDLLRRKRENDMAIISAQDQAEVAHLENEILGQDLIEGKEVTERRVKVNQTSPSLKHYLVPSPHTVSDLDSKDEHSSPCIEVEPGMTTGYGSQGSKPVVYSESSLNYDRQTAISYKDTPLSTSPTSLPLKNVQFHAPNNDVPNLGISQLPVSIARELNVLPFSTSAKLPNRYLQPGIKCSFQATPTPVSLDEKTQVFDEFPSLGHATMTKDKHGSSCNGSASTSYFATEFGHGTTPLGRATSIFLTSTYSTTCSGNLNLGLLRPKCVSSIHYSQPSFMAQWAPSTGKASPPYPSGFKVTTKYEFSSS